MRRGGVRRTFRDLGAQDGPWVSFRRYAEREIDGLVANEPLVADFLRSRPRVLGQPQIRAVTALTARTPLFRYSIENWRAVADMRDQTSTARCIPGT